MKNLLKKGLALIALAVLSGFMLYAEETPIKHLHSYKLDNGLQVFVAENHSAPLVYIEVTFRTGGISQTKETVGLCHLYEHLLFAGNTKYQNTQAINNAMNEMGAVESNGTTSENRVNYFFTVPVDQLEKGLEFWSYAVQKPLLKEKELEEEKKIVISEIQGGIVQPGWQFGIFYENKLAPEEPWTIEPIGPDEVIENATVAQLREIQKTFYIPNNAAVLVGGDVEPEQVYALVNKYFGDWEPGEDPWKKEAKSYSKNVFDTPYYAVWAYEGASSDICEVDVFFRGPDSDFDLKDTYTADILSLVAAEPNGPYKKSFMKNKNLKIIAEDGLNVNYEMTRRHGFLCFSGVMLKPNENLPARTKDFYETITKKAIPEVQKDKSLDSPKKRQLLNQHLNDDLIYDTETAKGLLKKLSRAWTYGTKDYFLTYTENLKNVEKKDLDSFFENYIYHQNPLVVVIVNPEVYEQTKQSFDEAGFVQISAQNAYWWNW